uniref:Chromo domain-containing protein n=1 Tax=Mesocestoides corti TaxID=53468 RepID=A0A5K3EKJ0_MESCO
MQKDRELKRRSSVRVTDVNKDRRRSGELEVEKILDLRVVDGKEEFLVKWRSCDVSENSWEPLENLNCPRKLRAFFIQRSLNEQVKVAVKTNPESPYGFDRGLAPSYISMVTRQDGELYFLIKWKGLAEMDVVPASQANVRCPQIVIGFYESILYFK